MTYPVRLIIQVAGGGSSFTQGRRCHLEGRGATFHAFAPGHAVLALDSKLRPSVRASG
jgi:hypothetical protein